MDADLQFLCLTILVLEALEGNNPSPDNLASAAALSELVDQGGLALALDAVRKSFAPEVAASVEARLERILSRSPTH